MLFYTRQKFNKFSVYLYYNKKTNVIRTKWENLLIIKTEK